MRGDECRTSLRNGETVAKDDARIEFRGRLEALQARIIWCAAVAERLGCPGAVTALESLYGCAQGVMRADVYKEPMPEVRMLGLDYDSLRLHSHEPLKYEGTPHIDLRCRLGELMAAVNFVRTDARAAERAAVSALPERVDIITALNRLSAAAYVLMLRLQAGKYAQEGEKD